MKLLIIVALLATSTPQDGLVDAAREGKRKRGSSSTKVITNKDVRQSKGKVSVTAAPATPEPAAPEPMSHEEAKAARNAAEERLKIAKAAFEQLAAELEALEQQYYAEDDLDRRDGRIVRQFNEVRARHDAAAAELEAAMKNPHLELASPVTVIGARLPPKPADDSSAHATPATPRAEPTPPPSQTPPPNS